VVFLVVIAVYLRMLWPTLQNAGSLLGFGHGSHLLNTSAGAVVTVTPYKGQDNPLAAAISSGATATPGPLVVVIATPVVGPSPVPSPTAAATATPVYQQVEVLYSYYNPSLGGINCHSANWDGVRCADTTASGIRWSEYIGRGVAVPPSWVSSGLGFGSVLRVVEPSSIAGDYTVIDLCNMCEPSYWPDGKWRLDFLDTRQRLTWAYPVRLLIVAIVKPEEVH
jgi:hypothetical protein